MLNENRLRKMISLAHYEENEGKTALPISKYYRTDYLGLSLIKNFFLITLAYILILTLVAVTNGTYLLDNAYELDIAVLIRWVMIGYVVLLGVYSLIVYLYYTHRYRQAQTSVRDFYGQLKGLHRQYIDEAKKAGYYIPDEEDFE